MCCNYDTFVTRRDKSITKPTSFGMQLASYRAIVSPTLSIG